MRNNQTISDIDPNVFKVILENMNKEHAKSVLAFVCCAIQSKLFCFSSNTKKLICLLQSTDLFIQLSTALLLCEIIYCSKSSFDWISELSLFLLESTTEFKLSLLSNLASVPAARLGIYHPKLKENLCLMFNESSPQMQYLILNCFWILTYEEIIAQDCFSTLVPICSEILRADVKEKIIRMVFALLHNLVEKAKKSIVLMIGCKIHTLVPKIKDRKLEDEEIQIDIDFVEQNINRVLLDLSTFDEYCTEVTSGNLEWTPVHTSDLFWTENSSRLAVENNGELIKRLGSLLLVSQNEQVLAIAAYDIGQFSKHYPSGRKLLNNMGVKHRLMELMNSNSANVRHHALVALEKFMTNSWDI